MINKSTNQEAESNHGDFKVPDIWAQAIDVDEFIAMEIPERNVIIDPWFRQSYLVMIYAERGIGKTWLGLAIALSITTGTSIGNWKPKTPTGVLYVDGEMSADEMQKRMRLLSGSLSPPSAPLKILSSDMLHHNNFSSVNINNKEWREKIKTALINNEEINVLILDNLSCLTPGIEENDKEAWDKINQWLLELRFLGIAVIFLHHAGKGGNQRGTSGREDSLDIVIKLSKPPGFKASEGAKVIVSFEKARGVCGDILRPFTFSIGDDEKGNLIWLTDISQSSESKKEKTIALLGSGRSPNDIMIILGVSSSTVSKHKIWALEKGYLIDPGRGNLTFTKEGFEKYEHYLIDF